MEKSLIIANFLQLEGIKYLFDLHDGENERNAVKRGNTFTRDHADIIRQQLKPHRYQI